jgi:S1-C subfamily serine protease
MTVSMILAIQHLSGSLSGKSQRVALQEGQTVRLGRAPESEIRFSDAADDSVSGLHAELTLQGGRLFVEDKRSSNGTLVNGMPCPPLQKVAVPEGARLRLGRQGPELQVAAAPAGAAPPAPKESVGRATLLREIDKARQEERNVVVGEIARTGQRSRLWLGAGLVLVLLLAAGGIGGAAWWNHKKSERLAADLSVQKTAFDQEKNPWPAVEAQVGPAVVSIKCQYRLRRPLPVSEQEALVVEDLWGGGGGSGVLIKPGLILTALHVVEPWKFVIPAWDDVVEKFAVRPEYDVLEVQFPGQQPLKASVVAVSAEHDLAILQVQQTNAGPVPLGQTNAEVKVTEEIAILGYPGNLGQYQVQVQNVSGFGEPVREITEVTPSFIQGTVAQPLTGSGDASHHLAFTAAIEPGNSGGPVVNRHGQVIGIVSFQFDRTGPPINILGEEIPTQLPSQVGSRAVSPDDIQSFLRQRGFV